MADNPVCPRDGDSALAVTSSIAGILTLCFAITATTWFHVNSVRKADSEFKALKAALVWYKKESEWINDLVVAQADYHDKHHKHRGVDPSTHRNAIAQANGNAKAHTTHNGAVVAEPEEVIDDIDACVDEKVRAAEEVVKVHEAHLQRSSRQNSHKLSLTDPNLRTKTRARKHWQTARQRVNRRRKFARAAHEEVLLRHKIVRERNMHTLLLIELAKTDRDLEFLVYKIDPPRTFDPDTNPDFRQPPDVSDTTTIKSGKSGRSRVRDEEKGISHTGSFPRTRKAGRRLRSWLQQWVNWHELSKLCIRLLPVSTKYKQKMRIAIEWLPKRDNAMELQRRREALGNRVVFATLAMIGTRLSDQEVKGSMHELLVKELVDTTRAANAEDERVAAGDEDENGKVGGTG